MQPHLNPSRELIAAQSGEPPDGDGRQPELLEQRLAGAMKLVEITRRLAAEIDLERILHVVTAEVRQTLDCERASLFLYDAEREELYTKVVTELEIREIRSSLGSGITGWVGKHEQILNVPQPAADERWNSTVDARTGFQTRNILAAPLISPHDGKLLGVLELLNKQHGAFDANDEQLLQAFADDAAIALERAELLETLRQTRELEGALDAARRIQASFLPEHLPRVEGYELAAWWQPAEAVGGDYYDVVPLPDGRLALAVADVSGHGLGPSCCAPRHSCFSGCGSWFRNKCNSCCRQRRCRKSCCHTCAPTCCAPVAASCCAPAACGPACAPACAAPAACGPACGPSCAAPCGPACGPSCAAPCCR